MSEKLDKFDKVEVAVKKTTKLIILIIGSIVTIGLAVVLAWSQLGDTINKKSDETNTVEVVDSVKVDTVFIKPIVETKKVSKPKPKKEEPKKEEVREDLIDKTDKVLDKITKLKGL